MFINMLLKRFHPYALAHEKKKNENASVIKKKEN